MQCRVSLEMFKLHQYKSKSQNRIFARQVSQYKNEPSINATENLLNWWHQNCERYPSLAIIAKKYLCIPATSVPSERVFSTASDIVTAQRSQLKSKHVDRINFLRKIGRIPLNLRKVSDEAFSRDPASCLSLIFHKYLTKIGIRTIDLTNALHYIHYSFSVSQTLMQ